MIYVSLATPAVTVSELWLLSPMEKSFIFGGGFVGSLKGFRNTGILGIEIYKASAVCQALVRLKVFPSNTFCHQALCCEPYGGDLQPGFQLGVNPSRSGESLVIQNVIPWLVSLAPSIMDLCL